MKQRIVAVIKYAAAGVFALMLLVVSMALCFRAYSQQQNAKKLFIHTPNGIQEGMYVSIGGIEQWIQIRGEDRDNPVLLFVHGGPGASTLPISSNWRPWEKYFTVVQWDQRGAGRTYRLTGNSVAPTMTVERMTQDGIEVTQFLLKHLHKDKVILIGHSWGSFLGINMVKKCPDLYSAFVGTGQFVGWQSWTKWVELRYPEILAAARAANNAKAEAEITAAGPKNSKRSIEVLLKWASAFDVSFDSIGRHFNIIPPLMPDFSLLDWYYDLKGVGFTRDCLIHVLADADLHKLGRDFPIPMFFFEATNDRNTPIEPVEEYFECITAPHKDFVRFDGANHFLPMNRADDFLKELLARVRPLAVPTHSNP